VRFDRFAKKAVTRIAAVAVLTLCGGAFGARAAEPVPACDVPANVVRLDKPLSHVSQKLSEHRPLVIVAIGSSSTAGTGATSVAANYPSRLEIELRQRFPGEQITVINRGVGGEEVPDMLRRFDQGVIAAKPDLVLWQLGTNSVLHGHQFGDHGALIRAGIAKIRNAGADIVLIDPQYAPKVIAKPDVARMVALIALTAKQEDVDLFHRFDLMKHWVDADHLGFETFVSPDGLHMNDWSYACMAKGLGIAIAEAATRPLVSAKATAARALLP
jgi:hypothetical protein